MDHVPKLFASAKNLGHVPPEVYARQDARRGDPDYVMSRSSLMDFVQSPAEWLRSVDAEGNELRGSGDTDATWWGTLMDCRFLTPGDFDARYVIAPDEYPFQPKKKGAAPVMKKWNWTANFCKEWLEEHGGDKNRVVGPDDLKNSNDALRRLLADKLAHDLMKRAQVQVMVVGEYHDKDTGLVIPCKAHIDIVPDIAHDIYGRCLCDFKTARNGKPRAWGYVVEDRWYHVQALLHTQLWVTATGEDRTDWLHLVQENEAPWAVTHHLCTSEMVHDGLEIALAALSFYAHCLHTNRWPGADTMVEHIGGWALTRPTGRPNASLRYEEVPDMLAPVETPPPDEGEVTP